MGMLLRVPVLVADKNLKIQNEYDTYINSTKVKNIDRLTKKSGSFLRKPDTRLLFSRKFGTTNNMVLHQIFK